MCEDSNYWSEPNSRGGVGRGRGRQFPPSGFLLPLPCQLDANPGIPGKRQKKRQHSNTLKLHLYVRTVSIWKRPHQSTNQFIRRSASIISKKARLNSGSCDVGWGSPFSRLDRHTTRRFALGGNKQCLPGRSNTRRAPFRHWIEGYDGLRAYHCGHA